MAGTRIKTDSKYDDYDYPTISPEGKSGHPGHTTPEQDAQVFQLRTQLEQGGYKERLDTLSMVHRASSTSQFVSDILCTAPISASQKVRGRSGKNHVGDSTDQLNDVRLSYSKVRGM